MSATMIARRSVLALLGLAPTAAVGAESFLTDADGKRSVRAGMDVNNASIAKALRNMADMAERGDIDIGSIGVVSDLRGGEIMKHELKIEFYYKA